MLNQLKDWYAYNMEKPKPGKELCDILCYLAKYYTTNRDTFHSAEGQKHTVINWI